MPETRSHVEILLDEALAACGSNVSAQVRWIRRGADHLEDALGRDLAIKIRADGLNRLLNRGQRAA
jgi:hypothetical protein